MSELPSDSAQASAVDETARPQAAGREEHEGSPTPTPTYWLTRFLILRLMGLVYLCAFLVAANQAIPLIGHDGLLPADRFLERVADHAGSRWAAFLQRPSLFWLGISDTGLSVAAWCGVVLSAATLLGFANAVSMGVQWALYLSIAHVGQLWFGYGWELLLLESGFLAIFLCPALDPRPFPRTPPPTAVIWLYRWLIFRVMFGAGMIKLRGDECWRDLTCLYTHYETQPVPNPLSPFFHFMPHAIHKGGVLFNHVAELFAPFFAFGPRRARHVAGVVMAAFQLLLIASGNLSFLNWLTLVAVLACFDDSFLRRLAPGRLLRWAERHIAVAVESRASKIAAGCLVVVVALLSGNPVRNMLSLHQTMNGAFDPLQLVNTYGAFGSINKERNEIVFEGTQDETLTSTTVWQPYEFKCKPGDPMRRPCWMSPYHYRLDWQAWFAAMTDPMHAPWTLHFTWKLLNNDPGTLSLLARNPFPSSPPRYIRATLWRYEFSPTGQPGWWKRSETGPWLPPLSKDSADLMTLLQAYGWVPGSSVDSDATDDDG